MATITLFLGGWGAPLSVLAFLPSWLWFFGKLFLAIFFFIWLRGTLPRLRQDQLMNFAWKFMLPMSLLDLFVAALWRFLGEWLGAGLGTEVVRWLVCGLLLAVTYVLFARVMLKRQKISPRSYRYAE